MCIDLNFYSHFHSLSLSLSFTHSHTYNDFSCSGKIFSLLSFVAQNLLTCMTRAKHMVLRKRKDEQGGLSKGRYKKTKIIGLEEVESISSDNDASDSSGSSSLVRE